MKKILLALALLSGGAFAQVPVWSLSQSVSATSIPGVATECGTFLATPSSANLAACVTDETGTGALYFVGGALGTPSSGTVTNLTSTASININGTVGATTPASGAFTTLNASGITNILGGSSLGITFRSNTIQTEEFNGTDGIAFNYNGYQNGTTQFRNFNIYNGKQTLIAAFSNGATSLTGTFGVSGAVTMNALTTAAGTPNSICQNNATKEITVNAALTCTVSSRDYKARIEPFNGDGLRMVAAMQPDTFFYRDRLDRPRIGLMAEDLAAIDPRLAEWTDEGKANSIDFPAMMGVMVKAIQQLQAEGNELKGRRTFAAVQ